MSFGTANETGEKTRGGVDMSDIVVHVAVCDDQTESRFVATVDQFAKSRAAMSLAGAPGDDAPEIMIKTLPGEHSMRKAVTFQDRQAAAEFLSLWRQEQRRG